MQLIIKKVWSLYLYVVCTTFQAILLVLVVMTDNWGNNQELSNTLLEGMSTTGNHSVGYCDNNHETVFV
jgi:hypothetical protein